MKKQISNRKTVQKLEKRLYKMISKEYHKPDGFYCEITEVALSFSDGKGTYTIDVHYGFTALDGSEIHRKIDDLIIAEADGKVELSFVAGQVYQYILDQNW